MSKKAGAGGGGGGVGVFVLGGGGGGQIAVAQLRFCVFTHEPPLTGGAHLHPVVHGVLVDAIRHGTTASQLQANQQALQDTPQQRAAAVQQLAHHTTLL